MIAIQASHRNVLGILKIAMAANVGFQRGWKQTA